MKVRYSIVLFLDFLYASLRITGEIKGNNDCCKLKAKVDCLTMKYALLLLLNKQSRANKMKNEFQILFHYVQSYGKKGSIKHHIY